MRLTRKLRINLGGRYTMYQVSGAVYHSLEPRISASYRLFSRTTLKVSYTEMSQFAHQLSNSYLNLPTDCWVPSTSRIRPMHSRQVAGGVYMELPWRLRLRWKAISVLPAECGVRGGRQSYIACRKLGTGGTGGRRQIVWVGNIVGVS